MIRIYIMQGYICQGDAFLSMDQFDLAEKSYLTALEIDPSIRRSKSFKVLLYFLRYKLDVSNSLSVECEPLTKILWKFHRSLEG